MAESQLPTETSKTELRPSGYSGSGLTKTQIEAAYRNLSERQRLVGALVNRARTQRGLSQFGAGELLVQIADSEPLLRDVPTWALVECFRLAMIAHNPAHPFGAGEVVMTWREMSEVAKQKLFEESQINALPSGPPCEWCNNTGRMRVTDAGDPVAWRSAAYTRALKPCYCKSGGDIPQPDPEPVVECEPFSIRDALRDLRSEVPRVVMSEEERAARRAELKEQARQIEQEASR